MRFALLLLFALLPPATLSAQDEKSNKRFGIAFDAKAYPQATAKEALASVLKAIDDKKIDYLVAHLADPTFVDDRVKRLHASKFAEQVADTTARLDPPTVKLLRQFQKDGTWTIDKSSALVQLDEVKDRCVRMVAQDGRWYLSHSFDPPAKD